MRAVETCAGLRLLALAALVASAALACLAAPVQIASAHAGLESSDPASGSSVSASPKVITLTFAEDPDASLSLVRLLDADGKTVPGVSAIKAVDGKPRELQVALTQALGQGVYTVNWRSVSAVDGHVQNGAFAFGVGVTPAPGSTKAVDLLNVSPWMSALGSTGRWLLYVGLALFVGATTTCLLVFAGRLPAGGNALLRLALLMAVVGFCAMVWAERALSGAPSLLPLFQTRHGQLLLALGVALVLCVAAMVAVDLWPARWSLLFLAAAGATAGLAHCLGGHADAPSSWRAVNVAAQWVHMTGIGVWVGGLAWLLLGIRGMTKPERAGAVGAFSRVATVTLGVVLATGVVRGLVEVGSFGNLLATTYGITLLVKIGLVLVLVALGALNHFRWVPSLKTHDGAARTFRMNSGGELAVAAAILAATAVLSGLAPASSAVASASPAGPPGVTVSGSDYATTVRAHLTVSPGTVGQNAYSLLIDGYDSGQPLTSATAVKLAFSLPSKPSLNASTLPLGKASDGSWRGAGLQLSVAGRWHIDVVVQEAAGGVTVPLELGVPAPGGG
ncbi:MAG: copper resistance protein CopC [Actinobacteria bacterium]|nr:copper resistance protein CopC [Actinomycetota bacterium]